MERGQEYGNSVDEIGAVLDGLVVVGASGDECQHALHCVRCWRDVAITINHCDAFKLNRVPWSIVVAVVSYVILELLILFFF